MSFFGDQFHTFKIEREKLFLHLNNHVLLNANKLDKNFCGELRDNLRACNLLVLITLFPPPHFDDAPFTSKNEAHGVY